MKIGLNAPKGKDRLPSIKFSGANLLLVLGRIGSFVIFSCPHGVSRYRARFRARGDGTGGTHWRRKPGPSWADSSKTHLKFNIEFSLEKLQRGPNSRKGDFVFQPSIKIRGRAFLNFGGWIFMNHISSPADTSKKFLLHYYDQPLRDHTFHCYHHFHHVILDSLRSMGRMLCSYAMLAEQGVPRQGSSSWKMTWKGWFLRCISDLGCHEKVRVNR